MNMKHNSDLDFINISAWKHETNNADPLRPWLYELGCRNGKGPEQAVPIGNGIFDHHSIQIRKFHQRVRAGNAPTSLPLRMVSALIGWNPLRRDQRFCHPKNVKHGFCRSWNVDINSEISGEKQLVGIWQLGPIMICHVCDLTCQMPAVR